MKVGFKGVKIILVCFRDAESNSFLSSLEVQLSIAQENKYLGKFFYFVVKIYVVYILY